MRGVFFWVTGFQRHLCIYLILRYDVDYGTYATFDDVAKIKKCPEGSFFNETTFSSIIFC